MSSFLRVARRRWLACWGLVLRGMMPARATLVAIAFLIAGAASAGTTQAIRLHDYLLHRLGPLGIHGWGGVDVDSDGRLDLVTSSDGPASLILVFGRVGPTSRLEIKQRILLRPESITALATSDAPDARLVTVGPTRAVTRWGHWPLRSLGGFEIAHDATQAHIGDVDADGVLELVVAGEGKLSAYSLPEGTLRWSITLPVTAFALASLDADAALELVVAGGKGNHGVVLDGGSLIAEWTRPEGFGSHIAVGDFGGSWQTGFLGGQEWESVEAFDAFPYGSRWLAKHDDVDALAAGDVDGDGQDEYAIGDGQWGSIQVHDATSRQQLYDIYNQGWGLWATGFLDFDGDQIEELWYSPQIERSSDRVSNFAGALVDVFNSRNRLTIESYFQEAAATLLADLDGDGTNEWAIGTFANGASYGLLRVADAESLADEWRAPYEFVNGNEPFQATYRSIHATQLDADAAMELVVVGDTSSRHRYLVLDGETFEVQVQMPPMFTNWFGTPFASRVVNMASGTGVELVLGVEAYAGSPNIIINAYTLPAGGLRWSGGITRNNERMVGMDVAQMDADPALEYLAIHTGGAAAFDAASGQLEWEISAPMDGARVVQTEFGPTLVAYRRDGSVTVYDVATSDAVQNFDLPSPMESLALLPERNDLLLGVAGERLVVFQLDGTIRAESGWIGDGPLTGDHLHVVKEGREWRVSTGRSFASFQHLIADPDQVFRHGFESVQE